MIRLSATQWNEIWYRGAVHQSMSQSEMAEYAATRPGWIVAEVVSEGYPPMYGAGPSAWLEGVSNA